MKIYKKGDDEYIENGYYRINGDEYMSIWTFKNHHLISPNNNRLNGDEGKQLIASGITFYLSKPDFGPFDNIKIYPIAELEKMYSEYF